MSAGICILNKNAIAMAADSAVTIGHHAAIHNSANKLFSLSRYEPIGVIIYANASFMEIPMEIIIKQYKATLGNQSFPSLEEYVDDFIAFMENNQLINGYEDGSFNAQGTITRAEAAVLIKRIIDFSKRVL